MSTSSSSNIIIRLQNLPNEARAIDIRRFFAGLNIPDGGVHVVGGEKGDAFINFSSDDDARQAMMKSGSICGNQIKLFLSSRSEMQTVIAQARANPPTKALPTNAVNEQQQQEDNNNSKIPSANTISTILAEFQAKAAQQQQLQIQQQQQQTAPLADPTQSLLLAAMQSGANPLAVQQLLTAFADKQQFPFQLPALTNPMNQFSQPNNGWMNQQYPNMFPSRSSTNLAFPQANPFLNQNSDANIITADEPYIRVRNIPVAYSYYNIKLLFSKYKLNLSDMKIINDQNGQRTGEIVLRLHTNHDVADILSQDGRIQCFNSMLDIKKIDEYTFASAIDSFLPAHAKKNSNGAIKNCVRVTGLPKAFERKDVKRFFNGCNVTNRPGGIFIETDTYNGPIFVEFESEIDAEKAFFYNGEQIGSAAIEMYRMTKGDMENEINSLKRGTDRPARRPPLLHHEPIPSNNRTDNSPHLLPNPLPSSTSSYNRHSNSPINTHSYSMPTNNFNQDQSFICLRLRNIPYSTTEQQIYDFFSSASIQISNCKILLDRLNRGAGEALVKFADTKSCQLAYETKNRQIFFGRTLDLRPLSLAEYQSTSITPMLTANDLASPTTLNQHFQQQNNNNHNNKRYSNYYERDNDRRNDKRPRWNTNSNQQHRNSSSQLSKDEQTTNERSSSPSNNIPQLPRELDEYVGRILFLSNVAYRATREEILDFLRAYSPIPETLKIRCDVNGKPTGYGVVACETKNDATRAVSELDNQKFMNRNIHLQQK